MKVRLWNKTDRQCQQKFNEYVAFKLLDRILKSMDKIDMDSKEIVGKQLKEDIKELYKNWKKTI